MQVSTKLRTIKTCLVWPILQKFRSWNS